MYRCCSNKCHELAKSINRNYRYINMSRRCIFQSNFIYLIRLHSFKKVAFLVLLVINNNLYYITLITLFIKEAKEIKGQLSNAWAKFGLNINCKEIQHMNNDFVTTMPLQNNRASEDENNIVIKLQKCFNSS